MRRESTVTRPIDHIGQARILLSLALMASAAMAAPAHAALVISTAATQNVSCSGNACEATAPNAVMNVSQLESMLATGAQVDVTADRSQKDIVVNAPIGWAHKGLLELYAWRSVVVNNRIAVTGQGGVAIRTARGELQFGRGASIAFWDLKSTLTINKLNYTLVPDIQTLSSLVAANPAGHYALARDYDASADGTYRVIPIATTLTGIFEGLGHSITHLSMYDGDGGVGSISLFGAIGSGGKVADLNLPRGRVGGQEELTDFVALLTVQNNGTIDHVSAEGLAEFGQSNTGGLVGSNSGTISNSYVDMRVIAVGSRPDAGELAALNAGIIVNSFSRGSVRTTTLTGYALVGGLVGENYGTIKDSYSLAKVVRDSTDFGNEAFGGLLGANEGNVVSAYTAGKLGEHRSSEPASVGGVTGDQQSAKDRYSNVYWDRDVGVHNPHQGVGNMPDYPGVTGLTTAQLQAGLPSGFDPHVWAHTAGVNGGLPYLRSNPPPQ